MVVSRKSLFFASFLKTKKEENTRDAKTKGFDRNKASFFCFYTLALHRKGYQNTTKDKAPRTPKPKNTTHHVDDDDDDGTTDDDDDDDKSDVRGESETRNTPPPPRRRRRRRKERRRGQKK